MSTTDTALLLLRYGLGGMLAAHGVNKVFGPRVVDRCLQLHGAYGYMQEYPIARMWQDSAQTIYGGTTEIMEEIIGREVLR
jgi:alkylation response protein AidB-like acyl-CoA dehydrogenase